MLMKFLPSSADECMVVPKEFPEAFQPWVDCGYSAKCKHKAIGDAAETRWADFGCFCTIGNHIIAPSRQLRQIYGCRILRDSRGTMACSSALGSEGRTSDIRNLEGAHSHGDLERRTRLEGSSSGCDDTNKPDGGAVSSVCSSPSHLAFLRSTTDRLGSQSTASLDAES